MLLRLLDVVAELDAVAPGRVGRFQHDGVLLQVEVDERSVSELEYNEDTRTKVLSLTSFCRNSSTSSHFFPAACLTLLRPASRMSSCCTCRINSC